MTAVVIGVGNRFRRDDGVGPLIADRIRDLSLPGVEVFEHDGEPAGLLDIWTGRDVAVVIDAIHSHTAPPGALHRVEVDQHGDTTNGASARRIAGGPPASHGLGPGDAVALGRVLQRLPCRLMIFGVEGDDFGLGVGLSMAVDRATDEVVAAVREVVSPAPARGQIHDDEHDDRRAGERAVVGDSVGGGGRATRI